MAERVGIEIPSDGGEFERLCAKMATGSGKTVVMAMVIAWQVLNKTAYPRDTRFSRDVLVIAPGLTVRRRLAVLEPSNPANYYREFNIVPSALQDKLRRGRVEVRNWHVLNWESDEQIKRKRSVDKRGALSDAAYAREVLGDMANARNLLVINDEAHHAWRTPAAKRVRGVSKAERDQATKWIGGLDRIARTRGDPDLLRLFGDAFRADRRDQLGGVAVRLDRERLWPERRDRGGAGEDAAGGGARRRAAGHEDLQVAALSHLQRSGRQGRPEPSRRNRGAAAGPGAERLLPAGIRLAGDGQGLGRGRGGDTAGDDHGGEPHRNGGAREARL